MRQVVRAAAAVVVVLFITGCPKRVRPPNEALESSAAQADNPNASARTLALAGFHSMLVTGDVEVARKRFDGAIAKDAADPFALYGELLLARRDGHPEKALVLALDLCDRAPTHPLCTAAARYALDVTGTSAAMDEQILQHAQSALQKGAPGDAAILLRSAMATVLSGRGDLAQQQQILNDLGMPQRWTVVGPLSPYSLLSFDEKTEPEQNGALPAKLKGAFGDTALRTMEVPGGRVSLSGEEGELADVFVVAVDADVAQAGTFVARTVTGAPHKLYLDGTLLFERRSFERPASTVFAKAVELQKGRHRFLIKLVKDERAGDVSLSVARADGQPSQITFTPATGAPASWAGASLSDEAVNVYPGAVDLSAALSEEAGDSLANFIAVRDGLGRDRDGARRLLSMLPKELASGAVLALRADANLADRTVPAKVARGRAARDLETALDKDPKDVDSLLERATLALDDSRFLDASEYAQAARAAYPKVGYPVPLLLARVQLGLGVDSQADAFAQEALQLQPGLCEALSLRYDLARRRDAVEQSDKLLQQLKSCPGSDGRVAEHLRVRGDLEGAIAALQSLVKRDPTHIQNRIQLSNAYASLKKWDEAIAELKALIQLWPRNATVAKRLGDTCELAGKKKEAQAARELALSIDGGDLPLRRQLERSRTGKELLEDLSISTKEALSAYETARGEEDATSAYILDAAAVRVYPDGSQVDRIHIIQKALDQSGVSDIAEVNIPAGAAVLQLRTLKADGTTLEPETFEHKETISLPGVQVGDYIEYEFLFAHPSRGPAEPGFTSASFYFQIANQPNNWSTYVVAAPKGTGMSVEAHNLKAPTPIKVEGNEEVFRHEERRVAPYIPEPDGPPSGNEFLPFVTVGAGETGLDGLVASYSDSAIDRANLTFEVEQFAKEAVADKQGEDAVRALYAAVMKRLSGRDSGLQNTAASSLSQDRGSRLLLLKAAFKAVGIPARLVAVRTFAADPAPYTFPSESLLPYVCLRVDLPQKQIWLDPLIRFAPFGELPEQAAGGRDGFVFPEPGLPTEHVKTPPLSDSPRGKLVKLQLKLELDGTLRGSGEETYQGFEAAQLAEALDSIPPDQRTQALQQALSRYFGGADLSNLKVDSAKEVGAPLTVRYDFTAPRFARVEPNDKLVLQPLTFPSQLGRRYVQLGARRTPLYIESTEENHTQVTLELPKGYTMKDVAPQVQSKGPAGSYVRREKLEGSTFSVDELFKLEMARISPRDYEAFGAFAGEVDLVQSRELLVEKK